MSISYARKELLVALLVLSSCLVIRWRQSYDKENGDGWFLLRLSVHDPIMPLNVESDSKGGVDVIYNKLYEFLKTTEGLKL